MKDGFVYQGREGGGACLRALSAFNSQLCHLLTVGSWAKLFPRWPHFPHLEVGVMTTPSDVHEKSTTEPIINVDGISKVTQCRVHGRCLINVSARVPQELIAGST